MLFRLLVCECVYMDEQVVPHAQSRNAVDHRYHKDQGWDAVIPVKNKRDIQ